MPRLRILLLAALVTLLSGGLCAAIAWRWLVRDVLARRAGRTAGIWATIQPRGAGLRGLTTGLRFLPLTWSGVLLALPLWVSAFPEQSPRGLWLGGAPAVVLPVLGAALFLVLLAKAYDGASPILEGDATTDAAPGAWRRPFVRHLAGAAVMALPAIVVGVLLLVSWPGLVTLRVAVVCAALAPAIGALLALPAFLAATNAQYVAPPPRTLRAIPRWATPVGFLTLAFAWGVVGARLHGVASEVSPFLSPGDAARVAARVELKDGVRPIFANVVASSSLQAAGLNCDSDVVQWTPTAADALGAMGWCDAWIDGPEGGRDGTVFFLTEGVAFSETTFPLVLSRTFVGPIEAVATTVDGLAVVERRSAATESRAARRDVVAIEVREPRRLVRTARRHVPASRAEITLAPLSGELALLLAGARPDQDRWIVLDRHLVPQLVSPWSRLREGIGAGWLSMLGIAALLTAVAVRRVARAGRLGRVIRRRAQLRALTLRSRGLFRGRLERSDETALLRMEGGEALAIDPTAAAWVGWENQTSRGGPCVVIGDCRLPRAGAYRGGLPEVRSGRPFAIVRGDLEGAITHADALREASLRRSLPLLWMVSLVPFAVVIASS